MKGKLREWAGVGAFLILMLILVSGLSFVSIREANRARETAEEIVAQSELNFVAIQRNGDFQTCVWRAIVKPRVVGHKKRVINAIRACDKRWLQ